MSTTPDPIALPELPAAVAYHHNLAHNPLFTADQMRAYGQACVEALTPAPQVPEGMVLVPREATDEMIEAAWDSDAADYVGEHKRIHSLGLAWAAMLSATPPLNEPFGNSEQLASLEQRARECSACKGAGEVMLPVWTPDPQDGYERLGTCPKCGGNGGAFPQALESLLYFTEHCLSAADEGADYSTSREWLDAMTTMGIMEKTGRGKWAPSDQAQSVVTALRAITAALSAQPRGVRGDVWGRLEKWLGTYADSIPTAAYHELVSIQPTTTPQDAAGVEEIDPGSSNFRAGYDVAAGERNHLAALIKDPVCSRCGAKDATEAAEKCRPEDCGCPATEFPLSVLWKDPDETTPPPGVDVQRFRPMVEKYRVDWAAFVQTMKKAGRPAIDGEKKVSEACELLAIIDAAAPGVGNG